MSLIKLAPPSMKHRTSLIKDTWSRIKDDLSSAKYVVSQIKCAPSPINYDVAFIKDHVSLIMRAPPNVQFAKSSGISE